MLKLVKTDKAPYPIKVTGWLNVYKDGNACFHQNKSDADHCALTGIVAQVKIEQTAMSGDGLK